MIRRANDGQLVTLEDEDVPLASGNSISQGSVTSDLGNGALVETKSQITTLLIVGIAAAIAAILIGIYFVVRRRKVDK